MLTRINKKIFIKFKVIKRINLIQFIFSEKINFVPGIFFKIQKESFCKTACFTKMYVVQFLQIQFFN